MTTHCVESHVTVHQPKRCRRHHVSTISMAGESLRLTCPTGGMVTWRAPQGSHAPKADMGAACLPGGANGKVISKHAPAAVDSSVKVPLRAAIRCLSMTGPRLR